jgi:two-component system response regulator FixJ
MTNRLVYVIDDDPDILRSIAFLLQSASFDVQCYRDGDLFLEAVDSLRPGCILTDLRMPRVSGYELKAGLAERSVAWPVILMTSENGPATAAEAMARGFAGYLHKPFSAEQLIAELESGFASIGKSGV